MEYAQQLIIIPYSLFQIWQSWSWKRYNRYGVYIEWCFIGTATKEEREIMSLRFRKSIKIVPGVKLNLNKKSASITLGGKGIHHTISTTGKKSTSVGIPGTGIYYTESSGGRKSKTNKNTNVNCSRNYSQSGGVNPDDNRNNKKWYQKTGGIIAWLILFFPIGLFLMWKYANWKKPVKGIISALFAFAIIGAALSPKTLEDATLSADTSKIYDIKQEIQIKSTLTPSNYDVPDRAYKTSGGELRITDGYVYFQADEAGIYKVWLNYDGIESNKLKINVEDKEAIAKQKAKEEAQKKAEEERIKAEQEEAERIAAEQAAAQAEAEAQAQAATQPQEPMVWIPASGGKYHSSSSCSGMNNPTQVPLSEAQNMGLTPCQKCY